MVMEMEMVLRSAMGMTLSDTAVCRNSIWTQGDPEHFHIHDNH